MTHSIRRREFLKTISAGMALAGAGIPLPGKTKLQSLAKLTDKKTMVGPPVPNVALIKGPDRKTNMYDALTLIENDIKSSIGDKQVVIKPNFTRVDKKDWLASTHVDNIRAFLEFLKPFYNKKVIIAEGTGTADPIGLPLDNYGYNDLKKDYDVEFFDLMKDTWSTVSLMDGSIHPMPVAASNLMLNPDIYLVSAAVMKTHSLALVTLGLKNILMAAPMNFGGRNNDRSKLHKDNVMKNPRYFNYNLFLMAHHVLPDLTLIDGFVGMQGNGPLTGDPIEVGVAIAGADVIAADRVGCEVMGHNFNDVGHLVYCADAGMGEGDLTKINLLGNRISECKKSFRPADSLKKIIKWK